MTVETLRAEKEAKKNKTMKSVEDHIRKGTGSMLEALRKLEMALKEKEAGRPPGGLRENRNYRNNKYERSAYRRMQGNGQREGSRKVPTPRRYEELETADN